MDTKERKPAQKQRRPSAAGSTKTSGKTATRKPSGAARGTETEKVRRKPQSSQPKRTETAAPKKTAARKPVAKRQSQAAVKERKTAARRPRKQLEKKTSIAQEVVYLPPKPFSRNRLLLRLATVVAVVLALVLGISVFFKVETVMVHGTNKYSANDILEASGIEVGDNLLTFSRAKAGG